MSETPTLTKAQRKRIKRAEKRKASGSPDIESGGHLSAGSTPRTGLQNTLNLNDSERYVNTVLTFNTPPTMNNAQQNQQYGYQSPQQHLYQQPFTSQGQPPPVFAPSPTSPPAWAIPLMEDIKTIKLTMPKIAEIESSVKAINLKVTNMDGKLTQLETKINDVENSVIFMSKEQEQHNTVIKKTKDDMKQLKELCQTLDNKLLQCKKIEETTTDKLLDLESRSMRENLMFYGIPEKTTTTTDQTNIENCELLVKDLITTKLQLDSSEIQMDRAHRIGSDKAKKPRPIVVKFHRFTDRETIRRKSQEEEIKTQLKGSNLGIGVQSPQQYRDARKALLDIAKSEEQHGNRARIIGNRLFVNNRPVKKFIDGGVIDI